MNAFVRRLSAIAMVWAVCEMLLPDGKQQQMVRMTAGLLVLTSLLSAFGQWLGEPADVPAWNHEVTQAAETNYRRTVLSAWANQLAAYCERCAEAAGYGAQAQVWLQEDGALECISLRLQEKQKPLISHRELAKRIAQLLQVDQQQIVLEGL
jgi:hypothetical protein